MFFPEYDLRLRGIEALHRVTLRSPVQADLIELGGDIEQLGDRVQASASDDFRAWGGLLRGIGYLVRWDHAVRDAESEADRYARAARQRAQDVLRVAPEGSPLHEAASAVVGVSEPEDLHAAATTLLRVRLPLPFPAPYQETGGSSREEDPDSAIVPALAFLSFYVGDQAIREPHDLKPNVLYDLRLEVRLSEKPAGWQAIEVTPSTVEPEGCVDAPVFRFSEVAGQTTLAATERLRVRVAHDALARPLEISYGVQAVSLDKQAPLKVQGQNRLLLRCPDESYLWWGHHGIEAALVRMRDAARPLGLRDGELCSFLTLAGAVAVIAAEALTSNIFPGNWHGREKDLQSEMCSRLRRDPKIGSELEEHPKVAGGVADLSFHGIRLELKVDARPLGTDQAFDAYGQQLAQYVVGSDRRTGVLVVLCGVREGIAPGALGNDIALRVVAPPTGGDRELAIGIVLLRANLQAPSSLARG